jgi:hypothetical protein
MEEATKRVRALITSFSETPFVKTVDEDNIKLELGQDSRLVQFDFTLEIDPSKPL